MKITFLSSRCHHSENQHTQEKNSEEDLLWKQYEIEIDLYKHYLELTVKFNVFYYAATGTILSLYFRSATPGVIHYFLLFPILMSIGFGALFIYAAILLRLMREDVFEIRDLLDLKVAPDLNVLGLLLIISAGLMFTVAVVLVWLFLK